MKNLKVHAVVTAAFVGPRPSGHAVNHKNGRKTDNRLTNIEYVTTAENNRHAYSVCGKAAKLRRGQRHHFAKITDADVQAIRERRDGGETLRQIGADYGLSIQAVANIATRKAWAHVK